MRISNVYKGDALLYHKMIELFKDDLFDTAVINAVYIESNHKKLKRKKNQVKAEQLNPFVICCERCLYYQIYFIELLA